MPTNNANAYSIEQRALRVAMYAAITMAVVGIGFAYAANSQAILLDGLFNVLLFVMVAISLSVSRRINQGPDEKFHFGYGGFEPFMVLVRSAMGLALTAYAFFAAIQTMIRGGAEVSGGLALVYSIVLAVSCSAIAVYMYRAWRKTGWPTMYAEFLTWVLNGVISSTAGVALFGAGFLRDTSLEWLVPYADSIVVLVMQLVLLPPPLQLLIASARELLGRAPDTQLESQTALAALLPDGFRVRLSRSVKQGRTELVMLEVGAAETATIAECDAIRERWASVARERFPSTYGILLFSNLED